MKKLMIIGLCLLLLPLSGCWGIREIQNQVFITGLGLEFKDGKYNIYFQSISFLNIAKQEGGSASPEELPVLVGKGTGETFEEAFDDIEKSSPHPLYFGHISILYFAPSVLKHHLNEFLDYAGRSKVIRYNTPIFGVEKNLKQIMGISGFFNKSPFYTFAFSPEEVLNTNSFIPVTTYQTLVRRYKEPVSSILIPSLKVDEKKWKEGKKSKELVKVNGGYVLSHQQIKGWMNEKDLEGLDWFNRDAKKMYLSVNHKKIAVEVNNPRVHIDVVKGVSPTYRITVKVPASLEENSKGVSITEVEKILEQRIKEEIQKTFEKGLEMKTDILNLGEKTYRFSNDNWSIRDLNKLSSTSIEKINVKIIIQHTSSYKS